LIFQINGSKII